MLCPQCSIQCRVVRQGDKILFLCRNPQCECCGRTVATAQSENKKEDNTHGSP